MCEVNSLDSQKERTYYLVDEEALPEVLIKTVTAKKLLETNEAKTASEAIMKADLSRGAFYKYRDLIKPFYDLKSKGRYTFLIVAKDIKGVLSSILGLLATEEVNILTINQNIPINGTANITVTVDAVDSNKAPRELIEKISSINGVKKVDIVST